MIIDYIYSLNIVKRYLSIFLKSFENTLFKFKQQRNNKLMKYFILNKKLLFANNAI